MDVSFLKNLIVRLTFKYRKDFFSLLCTEKIACAWINDVCLALGLFAEKGKDARQMLNALHPGGEVSDQLRVEHACGN
jgi:hypothetical protein